MAFGDLRNSGEIVVDDSPGSTGTTMSVTFTSAPSEDDLICCITGADQTVTSDDSLSIATTVTDSADQLRVFYKVAGASEGATYSFTCGSTTENRAMLGFVVEGPFDASPLETPVTGNKETGSGSFECPHNTGAPTFKTFTTTVNDEFLLAYVLGRFTSNFTNCTIDGTYGSSFVYGDEARAIPASSHNISVCFAYRVVSSTGTYYTRLQSVVNEAQQYSIGSILGFKKGSAGGGSIIPQAMYHYRNNSGSGL